MQLIGFRKGLSISKRSDFSFIGVLLGHTGHRAVEQCHRPPGIENTICCQKNRPLAAGIGVRQLPFLRRRILLPLRV